MHVNAQLACYIKGTGREHICSSLKWPWLPFNYIKLTEPKEGGKKKDNMGQLV